MPELAKVATKLQAAGIRVAAVDCDRAKALAQMLGVKGYPTIKFVSRGSGADYQGPRSALAMASFTQTQARVAAVKGTVRKAAGAAVGGAKLAMSKVLGRGQPKTGGGEAQPAVAAAA